MDPVTPPLPLGRWRALTLLKTLPEAAHIAGGIG
jgi:hypothetical protein